MSSLMVRGSSTGLQWSGISRARDLLRLRGSEDEDRNRESEDTLLRSGDFLDTLFKLSLCSLDKLKLDKDKFLDQVRTPMPALNAALVK